MGDPAASTRRRLVLHDFLSHDECKELEFIHKSNCTVGYRPNVFSTTLSHLVATNCAHLIVPFVRIREKIKETVEWFFQCEFELIVEFTGLISWTTGASIGWHSDDNRPYLKQREFTAVCYLNSYGKDFKGGLFHFRDGQPASIAPMAGDLVIYTADDLNIHSVDEIYEGERLTLTLWFSRDNAHDEDAKLISLLEGALEFRHPMLASPNMYWFSQNQDCQEHGFHICYARMHAIGLDICDSEERNSETLQVVCGNEMFELQFVNILHLLQVVEFYKWKCNGQKGVGMAGGKAQVWEVSEMQRETIKRMKKAMVTDNALFEKMFGSSNTERFFDWPSFSSSVSEFRDYTVRLHQSLIRCFPLWKCQAMIYCI